MREFRRSPTAGPFEFRTHSRQELFSANTQAAIGFQLVVMMQATEMRAGNDAMSG
jgi:hypothetical protein